MATGDIQTYNLPEVSVEGKAKSDTAVTTTASTGAVGSTFQSNYQVAWDSSIDNYIGNYSGKGGRLTQFVHNSSDTEDSRRGYIQLLVGDTDMSQISSAPDLSSNKSFLDAIYNLAVGSSQNYDRFIINSISESRAERISTMKTVGDSFCLTFSGREPLVISVSGELVFDYATNRLSWYTAFCNAYEYYLRASITAKYHAKIRLVLPDFTKYEGYIVSMNSSQSADSDMVVPFSFAMAVTSESFNRSYVSEGQTAASTESTSTDASTSVPYSMNATGTISMSGGTVPPDADGALVQSIANSSTTVSMSGGTVGTQATGHVSAIQKTISNATSALNKFKTEINKARPVVNKITSIANKIGIRIPRNSILR